MPYSSVRPVMPVQILRDTSYQPCQRNGDEPTITIKRVIGGNKTDYRDDEYLITAVPQTETEELRRDGHAECLLTGWMRRKILSTPGFPSTIAHPPKVAYEVRDAGRRGIGVFATENIDAGDLVLAERPLLISPIWNINKPRKSVSIEQMLRGTFTDAEENMQILCSHMSPEALETYQSLYNSHKTDGSGPLTGIMRTNAHDVGAEDPEAVKVVGQSGSGRYSCVGRISSRFNHDCSPNAVHAFNMPSFSMEIHAVRRIEKGEEITITYANEDDEAAARQAKLKPYGFTCACRACANSATSDKERKSALSNLLPKTSQGAEHADTILASFEATGLQCHWRYIELLRRVAKIHRKKGSKERADALEVLAHRVNIAQRGRYPGEEGMPTAVKT